MHYELTGVSEKPTDTRIAVVRRKMETPAIRIANMLQSHRGISFNAVRSNPGGQAFSGTSMLELEFAQLSDPGKVREHTARDRFIGCEFSKLMDQRTKSALR